MFLRYFPFFLNFCVAIMCPLVDLDEKSPLRTRLLVRASMVATKWVKRSESLVLLGHSFMSDNLIAYGYFPKISGKTPKMDGENNGKPS